MNVKCRLLEDFTGLTKGQNEHTEYANKHLY